MYKLVAIDLDGTTLNSFGEVTENTKRVIKEAIKKNTDVIISSGRSIDSIKSIAEEIGANKYIIAGNGAVIYDIQNKKIIYERYIPRDKIMEIVNICEENSIYYNIYTNKTIIADSLRYNVLYYYKENLRKDESKKTSITLVENLKEYIEKNPNEQIMKIFVCDKTQSVFNSIVRKFKKIENIDTLDISYMTRKIIKHGTVEIPIEYYYTELSMQDTNKWFALEFLINKLGISKDEVIAIGDNMNDKKMIEETGLGISVKNASPPVLEVADFITDDNNNEGVANAIEKFILYT